MRARELIKQLNDADELDNLEAKRGGRISDSVMETVCAFANTPDLGGGTLLLGVVREEATEQLFAHYRVVGISDPDQLQSDLASQCAGRFNHRIRPTITIENVDGKSVLIADIPESTTAQKPIYFEADGLPSGALLRVGPTDQHCTDDDLALFYAAHESYDGALLDGTTVKHIDAEALGRYRTLRARVNADAEELALDDAGLLEALNCKGVGDDQRLTVAGVLLFGTSAILRRLFPMMRLDYIRVPGKTWMADVDAGFTNLDLRGPLFLTLPRMINEVYGDLPRAFQLAEGELQASTVGLPSRALREALTNAVMHRSYRVQSPIQIIRYDNRIEIVNPGYSLKPEEHLGRPKSVTRNGTVAAAFHETNLAETKGTGIRRMRNVLREAGLSAPTFQSDRRGDDFTARLLLHHFFTAADVTWLATLADGALSEPQQQAAVFLREVGAIDNLRYRQLTGRSAPEARADLASLIEHGLILRKGRTRGTYYVPTERLTGSWSSQNTEADGANPEPINANPEAPSKNTEAGVANTEPLAQNTQARGQNTGPRDQNMQPRAQNTEAVPQTTQAQGQNTGPLSLNPEPPTTNPGARRLNPEPPTTNPEPRREVSAEWGSGLTEGQQRRVASLPRRIGTATQMTSLILDVCARPRSLAELAYLFRRRDENHLYRIYIQPLLSEGKLRYLHPDMPNHPQQAYVTADAQPA